MKHIYSKIIMTAFVCVLALGSCNESGKSGSAKEVNLSNDASYAIGMDIGMMIKQSGIVPNMSEFMKGVKDVLNDKETRFSFEEYPDIVNEALAAMSEKANSGNKQAGVDFLVENSKKPGVQTTASGLQYEVLVEGNGKNPTETSRVRVNYEGSLPDGTVFDSSYSRGEPVEFALNEVIRGWTEGLQLMSVGSTYRLFVPSELGYGSSGRPGIPPYSPLIFKVELLDIL